MVKEMLTPEDIWNYCLSVLDLNDIHNFEAMAKLGKMPLVPGIQLFSMAACKNEDLMREAKQIHLSFGDAVYPGQDIEIPYSKDISTPDSINKKLSVIANGTDFFTKKEDASYIRTTPGIIPVHGFRRTMPYNPEQIRTFVESFGGELSAVSKMLFAIAYSCNPLHEASFSPANSSEEDLCKLKAEGRLAMYNTIDIALPRGIQEITDEPFDMTLQYDKNFGKAKESLARICCEQGGRHLYTLDAHLFDLPERGLIKKVANNYCELDKAA